jgi:hypothetical protein
MMMITDRCKAGLYRLKTEAAEFTRWLPQVHALALQRAGYRVTRLGNAADGGPRTPGPGTARAGPHA